MPSSPFAISFGSDNHSGVHPVALEALAKANHGHCHSYGGDPVSNETLTEWRRLFGPQVQVGYVFNGTAANVLSLKLFLQDYEACIVSDMAHLYVDECAAPESVAGIKLLPAESKDGKLTVAAIEKYLIRKGDQHYVQPRMISLTQPTEVGTVYSMEELKAIVTLAKAHSLFVHIDGARFIHAAYSLKQSLYDLSFGAGVDVVSFGGTKNGLMGAEAVLFNNPALSERFKFLRKQMMQLSSKTRFLATQFQAFLKGDLWRDIAQANCDRAQELKQKISAFQDVRVLYPVQSNALFVQVPETWIKPLRESHFFYVWDESTRALRWMMSFDVTSADLDSFVHKLRVLKEAQ